jgi:hypothetical protein
VVGNPRQSSKNGITTSNWARPKNQCDLGNAESWLVYVISTPSRKRLICLTGIHLPLNKIFTLRSPLYIKYPNGETRVIEEIFQHPEGILYFELFWEKDPR